MRLYWPLRGGASGDALAAALRDKPSLSQKGEAISFKSD